MNEYKYAATDPAPSWERRPRSEARRSRTQVGAKIGGMLEDTAIRQPAPPEVVVNAWEDTSTHLEIPEQTTFFNKQPPAFWIAAAVLLVSLFTVIGLLGVDAWKEAEINRAEQRRLQQLAEEKRKYKLVYRDWIEENAAKQKVDPALVAAVIYHESRFEPDAVSRIGARGLMQIMEATGGWIAEMIGEKSQYTFEGLYDPKTNIRYGVWYLGYLTRFFDGDLVKILAGYNAGQNRVNEWLENPQYSSDGITLEVIPYQETDQYVKRVISAYEIYTRHYYTPGQEEALAGQAI